MAARFVKLFIFSVIYFFLKPPISIEGQQVPCLFIMGDSLFDNGNNNFLLTLAKSNYLPYGIDYPDGPTGRFCNGRIIPDFLAEFLGFDKPIPPFATANGAEILKGVNYASGGSGILDDSGRLQGDRMSMNRQLFNHKAIISKIALMLGNATLAKEHLNKCLYVVNMGNNEYVNNYLLSPLFLTSTFYTPQQFATIVISQYSQQLKSLYNYGARKVVVYGLALLGCIPQNLSTNHTNGTICNDSINKIVQPFNVRLKSLIDALNADLNDVQFIMINATNFITLGDDSSFGIKVKDAACCTVSKITGLCVAGKEVCRNRNEYLFWDNYHLSEIGNRLAASRSYDADIPTDVYPFDIRRLVQQ